MRVFLGKTFCIIRLTKQNPGTLVFGPKFWHIMLFIESRKVWLQKVLRQEEASLFCQAQKRILMLTDLKMTYAKAVRKEV